MAVLLACLPGMSVIPSMIATTSTTATAEMPMIFAVGFLRFGVPSADDLLPAAFTFAAMVFLALAAASLVLAVGASAHAAMGSACAAAGSVCAAAGSVCAVMGAPQLWQNRAPDGKVLPQLGQVVGAGLASPGPGTFAGATGS